MAIEKHVQVLRKALFLFFLFSMKISYAATICTMTLNSDNEKKLFKNKFSQSDVQFIELTDYASRKDLPSDDWFENACRAQVECDVLLISGHFGLGFFGDHGFSLPLGTLEEKSCTKTCDGILKKPKKVFMMGCNTLAGKDIDFRTPEAYQRALIEHGVDRYEAQQIVTARYAPIGFSTSEKMQRIFENVPVLFGFNSIAPTGQQVEKSLQKYLQSLSIQDLLSDESGKKQQQISEFKKTMSLFSVATVQGVQAGTPQAEIKKNMCEILGNSPIEKRLQTLKNRLSENPLVYISTASQLMQTEYFPFLKTATPQFQHKIKQLRSLFQHDLATKNKLNELLHTQYNLATNYEILQFLLSVGWIEFSEFDHELEKSILQESAKATISSIDNVCSLIEQSHYVRDQLILPRFKQFLNEQNKPMKWRLLSCISQIKYLQKNQAISQVVAQLLKQQRIVQLTDMEIVQISSVIRRIDLPPAMKDAWVDQVVKMNKTYELPQVQPYLSALQLARMTESHFQSLIVELKRNFDIINYDLYFEALNSVSPIDQTKMNQLIQAKIDICKQEFKNCYFQKEIKLNPSLVQGLLNQMLERGNVNLTVQLAQLFYQINSDQLWTIHGNVDNIMSLLSVAHDESEIFYLSYLLQGLKLNLTQLMQLQKYYLQLQKPKSFGYYLAKILNQNRRIMPILVDFIPEYHLIKFEESKMTNTKLLYYEKRLINGY